jgi:hypothetical protein
VDFQNASIYIAPSRIAEGNHVNNTLWTYSSSPCTEWVEQGVTLGYHGSNEYGYYMAYVNKNGYQDQFLQVAANGDNSVHKYSNWYAGISNGYGYYDMTRDDKFVATIYYLGFGTCNAQAGMETSMDPYTDGASESSGTFDSTPLNWKDAQGVWHGGWNTADYWIDDPCPLPPGALNCFNGTFYGSDHWAANIP